MNKKQVKQIINTVSEPAEVKLVNIEKYYNDYSYEFSLEYAGIQWFLVVGTTTSASPNEDDNKTNFEIADSSGTSLFSRFKQSIIDATITGSWEFLLFKTAIELADKMFTKIESENKYPEEPANDKLTEEFINKIKGVD